MNKNLLAYTAMDGTYPGFVSINRNEAGDVEVTVRAAPTVREGVFVCGTNRDLGKHGRCTPGGTTCNNYCNLAPQKGPMPDHPLPCTQVFEGKQASFTVPAAEWEKLQP